MIDAHLAAGHDVVVPQFLARPDFIEELATAADAADAHFVELALGLSRSVAIAAFGERSAKPSNRTHVDAASLIGDMYDALETLLAGRTGVRRVPVIRDDVNATFHALIEAISAAGVNW